MTATLFIYSEGRWLFPMLVDYTMKRSWSSDFAGGRRSDKYVLRDLNCRKGWMLKALCLFGTTHDSPVTTRASPPTAQ